MPLIIGTLGNDRLVGNFLQDRIFDLAGNDLLIGARSPEGK